MGFWKTLRAWIANQEPEPDPPTVPEWSISSKAWMLEHELEARFGDMLHTRAKQIAESHGRMSIYVEDVELAGKEIFATLHADQDAVLPPECCKGGGA